MVQAALGPILHSLQANSKSHPSAGVNGRSLPRALCRRAHAAKGLWLHQEHPLVWFNSHLRQWKVSAICVKCLRVTSCYAALEHRTLVASNFHLCQARRPHGEGFAGSNGSLSVSYLTLLLPCSSLVQGRLPHHWRVIPVAWQTRLFPF